MLTALMLTEYSRPNAMMKLWRRLVPPPVTAAMCRAAERPYVMISCERNPDRPLDWRMIAAYCLDNAGRILAPPGVCPPVSCGLRRFRPTRFCRRLLENLALDILVCSEAPPSRRRIALYGREHEISELLPRLIPLAGSLHIISRRAYVLENIVAETVSRTGVCITLSDTMSAHGCGMLLAPSGGAGIIAVDSGTMVIAPDRPLTENVVHIGSALPMLPAALEELGEYYDTLELCGAFYELAGAGTLGMASPRCGLLHGSPMPPEKLAPMLHM